MADAAVVADRAQRCVLANAAAARLFGRPAETFAGLPVDTLPWPSDEVIEALARGERLDRDLAGGGAVRVRPEIVPGHHLVVIGSSAGETLDRLIRAHEDAAWTERLHEVTAALSRAGSVVEAASAVARLAMQAVGAQAAALALLSPDGESLRMVASFGLDGEIRAAFERVPLATDSPATEAARARTPVFVESEEAYRRRYARSGLPGWPGGSRAAVPLGLRDGVLGTLAFGFADWRPVPAATRRYLELVAAHCALAVERARLLDGEREAHRRLRLLSDAAEALRAPGLPLAELLERIVRQVAAATGDLVLLRLVSDDGAWLEPVAFHHPDPEALAEGARLLDALAEPPDARGRERAILFLPEVRPAEIARRVPARLHGWLERHPVYGLIGLALAVNGRPVGGLTVARPRPGAPYRDEDRRLVEGLGEIAAAAIENARLREQNERARAQAERGAERAARLAETTAALARAVTEDEVGRVTVESGRAALGGASCALFLLEEGDAALRMAAYDGVATPVTSAFRRVPNDGSLPASAAVREGEPTFFEDERALEARFPSTAVRESLGPLAVATVPLRTADRALGALSVRFAGHRRFEAPDRELLVALASQCAQALERVRLLAGLERELVVRRRAEADLARSQRLFESMAEASPDIVYLFDVQQRCNVYVNRGIERILGVPASVASDYSERQLVETMHPDDVLGVAVASSHLPGLSDDDIVEIEYRARHAAGGWRWLRARARVFSRTASGEVHLVLGVSRDVTEQKQAEAERLELLARERAAREAAESANRTKDEFLAMLGHELRNPLAPMVTALELMRLEGGEAFAAERQVIQRQVAHLSRLVDDLLDVSRIMRGKVDLRLRPVDLADVVDKAVEMASPLFERRGHRLALAVPRGRLVVDADEERLAQVFANLLTNAARYTEPGGDVEVTAAADGDEAVVRVRDTGIGLPPALVPRIFDLFVQGDRGPERSGGGLGLGLAIARRFTELHGGHITAASEGLGRGSEFTVRLPRSGARVEARPEPDSKPPLPAAALRVLIVDDNADAADLLGITLRRRGYAVAVAHDGPQALALASSFGADVALVDIGLPVMDGHDLARALRARLGDRSPALVAVTGYGQASDRRRSAEAGFAAHLVKPVRIEELCAVIEAVADARTNDAT